MERASMEKLSHHEVAYENPATGMRHCSQCQHFIPRGDYNRCEIVRTPIAAGAWCEKFKTVGDGR